VTDEPSGPQSGETAKLWASSQLDDEKQAFLRWVEEETEKLIASKQDRFDSDFFRKIRSAIERYCVSEDVSSMCHRWTEKMQFSPWVEVQSDREGYREFVCIDFRNPIVRAKWESFLCDQGRVKIHTDYDPLSKLGATLGSWRLKQQQKGLKKPADTRKVQF